MHFAVDGYTITGDPIALQNSETIIRVGTGAPSGSTMTATIASVLTGTGGLVKTDYGTLILSGNNSYSGGTFVRGGVLQVASDSSLGAAAGGLVIEDATLRTTANMTSARAVELAGMQGFIETVGGTSLTLSGTVSGAASLVKEGAGTLVLSGNNSYAGGTFVRGGVLQVASDNSLGAASGGLVLDEAALRTTANMISARAVELAGTHGTIETWWAGTSLTLSGTVSGAGSLIKEGAGTLVLNGTNSYAGDTFVNAGRLEGNAGSIRGDLTNNGETVFDQATVGTFAGKVDGSGLVIKQGAGQLIQSGYSTARWQVDAGMLTSAAWRFTGDVDIGAAGTMNFNHTADGEYGGTLSGSGALLKTNAGVLKLLANSGDFAGDDHRCRRHAAGDQHARRDVAVGNGASLGGTGALTGAVSIANGGKLWGRQGTL